MVYFYPSAYTGGCDAEAHAFAEMKDKFTAAGATIIGVSGDDIKRLNTFSADPKLQLDPAWKPSDLRAVVFIQEQKNKHIIGAASLMLSKQ